jgi:hypothetical protein
VNDTAEDLLEPRDVDGVDLQEGLERLCARRVRLLLSRPGKLRREPQM